MKKLLILCTVCCTVMLMSAQTQVWSQQLVNNIARDIRINSEQTQQLQAVADEYIAAMQQANQQYTDDTECTKAKERIYQSFQTALQEVLTAEQYDELKRVREERLQQHNTNK